MTLWARDLLPSLVPDASASVFIAVGTGFRCQENKALVRRVKCCFARALHPSDCLCLFVCAALQVRSFWDPSGDMIVQLGKEALWTQRHGPHWRITVASTNEWLFGNDAAYPSERERATLARDDRVVWIIGAGGASAGALQCSIIRSMTYCFFQCATDQAFPMGDTVFDGVFATPADVAKRVVVTPCDHFAYFVRDKGWPFTECALRLLLARMAASHADGVPGSHASREQRRLDARL